MYKGRKLTIIIAAGGAGRRFGAEEPKQFMDISGRSMLMSAADPFVNCRYSDEIIFTIPCGYEDMVCDLVAEELGAVQASAYSDRREFKIRRSGQEIRIMVLCGGQDRAASVRAGLEASEAVSIGAADGLVLVHDAARPFVKADLIERVIEAAYVTGAAVPGVQVQDTVYITGESGFARDIPDRALLRAVQTPQGFDFRLLKTAHERVHLEQIIVTDDGMPVLAGGGRVAIVEGDPSNIKVTTKDDLKAQTICLHAENLRVGIGFDAHRFEEGRPLFLGGVKMIFEKGLAGHSDADVLTHALMDAILGALHEGDIGKHFPDTNPAYAGISSMILLDEVASLMCNMGYEIVNADMTIVAERPRMTPYITDIEYNIANSLRTSPENISLKATTTEKLGFTGREEGIAAEAIVLLKKKDYHYETIENPFHDA